jgi:hypothetical protein
MLIDGGLEEAELELVDGLHIGRYANVFAKAEAYTNGFLLYKIPGP